MDQETNNALTLDELEKSWSDSRDTVLRLLGDDVQKAKSEETEEDEETVSEEEMDFDEEEDEEKVKKSIEDTMDADEDSQVVMDVEPFLRELVKSIDARFEEIGTQITGMASGVKSVDQMQKAMARMMSNYGELQKSMSSTVEAIGNTAQSSSSVLRKSTERFEAPKSSSGDMSKVEIMNKATRLREKGKLEVRDITKLENRLNKGMEIPEHIEKLLREEL